ncbi:MAG: hypothetical protein WC108_06775 [Bacteroidales bacterium]|jgi:hypothetical protein|nr:hypothetical protein [Bacteroidales bacterium]MDD4002560.1 hypothetical protein [Bacteroidales bacterium]
MEKLFNFTCMETVEQMQTNQLYNYHKLKDEVYFMQLKDEKNENKDIPRFLLLIDNRDGMFNVYKYNKKSIIGNIDKSIILNDFNTYLMPLL